MSARNCSRFFFSRCLRLIQVWHSVFFLFCFLSFAYLNCCFVLFCFLSTLIKTNKDWILNTLCMMALVLVFWSKQRLPRITSSKFFGADFFPFLLFSSLLKNWSIKKTKTYWFFYDYCCFLVFFPVKTSRRREGEREKGGL